MARPAQMRKHDTRSLSEPNSPVPLEDRAVECVPVLLGSEEAPALSGEATAAPAVEEAPVLLAAAEEALSQTREDGPSPEVGPFLVETAASPEVGPVLVETAASLGDAPALASERPLSSDDSAAPAEDAAVPARAQTQEGSINYDDEGLLEVELDESQYRFDAGKQGTALCLSVRALGTYRWSSLGELKWDGRDLRSKSLERKLLGQLSLALRDFSQALGE